jgi:ABC-type sugar transport system ATPase subunit
VDSTRPPLLEIDHLTKVYKGLAALDDVSLRVERAAVHAVVGEAGAGKTTLMKVLGGFLRAGDYAGDLRLQGAPLRLRSPADALRAGIAIVPRKIALMENASVTENIALGSSQVQRSFWMSREADRAASQQLLHDWSMDIDPAAPVRSLAPLQRRLLMIARGLAVNPKVIVLDEPLTDVSGFHATAQLLRFVRRLAEHGLACLYLTQRVPDALVVANTITALRDGRVVETWRARPLTPTRSPRRCPAAAPASSTPPPTTSASPAACSGRSMSISIGLCDPLGCDFIQYQWEIKAWVALQRGCANLLRFIVEVMRRSRHVHVTDSARPTAILPTC